MIRYQQQGSNWLYRLTSLAVSSFCMLDSQVVADQMLLVRSTGDETIKSLNNNAITIGTAIAMVTLLLLFAVAAFIRRRKKARIAPTSMEWKIYNDSFTDFNLSKKRYIPSHRTGNSFSTKPTFSNLVSYPNKSYPRNAKNLFGSRLYMDGSPCLSDSRSESYPLRNLSSHSQTIPKLPDVPPSLGDVPMFRTESDTWEKYLIMMSNPEKLNEAVDYMKRTGHSPHNSSG